MRPLLLVVALASCAPNVLDLGALPVDVSTGDVAPADDAGRTDVAPTPSDASDGAAAPDVTPEASTATDASAEATADVSVDVADAANASDARETTACVATCEGLPHVVEAECINGTLCAIRRCERDFADCNSASADGCETSTRDRFNCGSCGIRCPSRLVCTGTGCA